MKRRDVRVIADHDQPCTTVDGCPCLGERHQQPDQIELIEQIVLEPQDDLVCACRFVDGGIAGLEVAQDLLARDLVRRREEACPRLPPFGAAQARQARAVVEGIGAADDAASHTAGHQRVGDVGAVGEVDHEARRQSRRHDALRHDARACGIESVSNVVQCLRAVVPSCRRDCGYERALTSPLTYPGSASCPPVRPWTATRSRAAPTCRSRCRPGRR